MSRAAFALGVRSDVWFPKCLASHCLLFCRFLFFFFSPFWKPLTMGIPTDNCSPGPQTPPTLMSLWRAPSSSDLMLWPSALRPERLVRSAVAGSGARASLVLRPSFSASSHHRLACPLIQLLSGDHRFRKDLHLPTAELSLNSKSQFSFFISLPGKIFSSFKTLLGGIYLFQEAFPKTVFYHLSA